MSRIPIDLAELVRKKKALAADLERPRFLTAAQREEQKAALAFEKRAREVEARNRATQHADQTTPAVTTKEESARALDKRKRRRVNDPRKINFDWDVTDDTSASALALPDLPPTTVRKEYDRVEDDHVQRKDDLHWSQKALKNMKERDWRIFKEDFNIQVKGSKVPRPIRSWEEAQFPPKIMNVLADIGYKEPTAIQRAAIPIALAARDLIGIAETGSGKTASFVLPMLSYIHEMPTLNEKTKFDGPLALVLAPTRELAQQIEAETRKFASALDFIVVSIVGGRSIEEQAFALRDGAEIVIATPGRLIDCLERHVLVLSQCTYVVMDEADRMVDLGFEDEVNAILDALPTQNQKPDSDEAERTDKMQALISERLRYRQTVMFSATMAPAVDKLARKYLRRPATVLIGNAGQAVDSVEQRVEIVNGDEKKRRRIAAILNSGEFDRPVIVFVSTKKSCDSVARHLSQIGWKSVSLHGGKTQDQREASLTQLRSGEADVLVATDLAGRGIDVADVTLVVNYDMSKTIEDYVHRIGRTGRAGKTGVAITFVQEDEEELFFPLKQVLGAAENIPAQIRNATKEVRPQVSIET